MTEKGQDRTSKKGKGNSAELIRPHHAQVAAWYSHGLTLQEIARRLEDLGVEVNRNAIDRYVKKQGLMRGKQPPATGVPSRAPTATELPFCAMDLEATVNSQPKGEAETDTLFPAQELPPPSDVSPTQQSEEPDADGSTNEDENDTPSVTWGEQFPAETSYSQSASPVPAAAPPPKQDIAKSLTAFAAGVPTTAALKADQTNIALPSDVWTWRNAHERLYPEVRRVLLLSRSLEDFHQSMVRILVIMQGVAAEAPEGYQEMTRAPLATLREWVDDNHPDKLQKQSWLRKLLRRKLWPFEMIRLQKIFGCDAEVDLPKAAIEKSDPEQGTPPSPLYARLPEAPVWPPDLTLVQLAGGTTPFTLRDACEGIAIFGSTGSGKTTGSGAFFAKG